MSRTSSTASYAVTYNRETAQRGESSWRKWLRRGLATIVAAAVTALVASVVTDQTVHDSVADMFTKDPSPAERDVAHMVSIARSKVPWTGPLTIYQPSVDYLREHFGAMAPARTHEFPSNNGQPTLSVESLVNNSALLNGQPIMVSGEVTGEPRPVLPDEYPVARFAVNLTGNGSAAAVCVVPLDISKADFRDGDRVSVFGVLLAEGQVTDPRSGKPIPLEYLSCASIAHSVNIQVVPGKALVIDAGSNGV